MYRKYFFVLVLSICNIGTSWAQCLSSCSCAAMSTDITNHAIESHKGDWQLTTGYLITQFKPFTDEDLTEWTTVEAPIYSVSSQQTLKIGALYNITDHLKVSAALPYNISADNREGHTHNEDLKEVHEYGTIKGLGDATLLFSYEWLLKNQHGWRLSSGLGIKMPTGKKDVISSTEVLAPPHLQPGSGSWDPLVTLRVRKAINRWTLSEDVFGKLATMADDHNMGNYLGATTGAVWQCIPYSESKVVSLALVGAAQAEE